jgi:hypothetical protein
MANLTAVAGFRSLVKEAAGSVAAWYTSMLNIRLHHRTSGSAPKGTAS